MNAVMNQHSTGYRLLHDPRLNKGTAFTLEERRKYGLEGLLPPAVTNIDVQIARRHAEITNLDDDLQKYLVLSDLQARNERLFYSVLMSDPAAYMPLVYTPTVGEACQKFGHIFRQARGIYLPISARGRVRELLSNWPEKDVRFIVVTDGERILGLGDLGAGGMGIPIGKLALDTACAGVPPQYCLPVVLDVGTNNQSLVEDPLYLGLRQPRVRGEEYMSFVDEFVAAVQALYPKCCIQWEDFANINAVPILARYRDQVCTYNDDIQGTAGVALAGIFAALRITGQKLTEQRFLFLGGGSAGTGIAELISQEMALQGMDIAEARHRNALFDINGLIVTSRTDLADLQKPFAQDRAPVATFVEAVKAIRPTGIIGVSAVPKLFTRDVIEAIRGGLSLVRRASCLCQRQPVSPGRDCRPPVHPRPGQQRLHLPGNGHGRVCDRGDPGDRGDVHRCRKGRRRAGHRGEFGQRADLPAAEPYPRCLAARRRAGRRIHL